MKKKSSRKNANTNGEARSRTAAIRQYLNLRLAMLGPLRSSAASSAGLPPIAAGFLARHRETLRVLADHYSPVDARIQQFLDTYLKDTGLHPRIPTTTFVLDAPGLAAELSLPAERDEYLSGNLRSYRTRQGALHNPQNDRRTTKGAFHIAEGGLPIPDDKVAVPKKVFARLLSHALRPPLDLRRLPFTVGQDEEINCWVSLLLRPMVCPEVPGVTPHKSLEVRFFAPGTLVSNLDFVERIFGNAGDPYLPENDASLDVQHWTGHTGCVILAPHLIKLTKESLGLPSWDSATERQQRDGLAWKSPEELYNDGNAFKATCRDDHGVMVTVIADNYFGYCKKEVKTQISYSANLFGLCEEEHSGGALVYASYDLGEEWSGERHVVTRGHSIEEVLERHAESIDRKPEGHGVDRKNPKIVYVPESSEIDLRRQVVRWKDASGEQSIRLSAKKVYMHPSGYRVRMVKPPGNRAWRLVGTVGEGILCHKPCTVSGGGKSEISKPISDAVIQGPVFVGDFHADLERVDAILRKDCSGRFRDSSLHGSDLRPVLSPERTLGSVIKLLTPSQDEFSDEYNAWLESIPQYLKEIVFVVKRFYKPEWGDNWKDHFSVDLINGKPANELKCDGRLLVSNNLRVGYAEDGSWRVFGLRKDFYPAAKLQVEDDITASVVVPTERVKNLSSAFTAGSVKFVVNCERRLFQRPDDAIHRGYDHKTERDFSLQDNFFSNYEPLTRADAVEIKEDAVGFSKFTYPMRKLVRQAARSSRPAYFVSSAHPRLVSGVPSKNPRYLQLRPDLADPRDYDLATRATRLRRRIGAGEPVPFPVAAVVPGRRNNPPDAAAKIRSLAVFNPIHYMELPELFMEFTCSLTGKSPSTTGAGSEGALTKGPFNALPAIIDLNNALVAFLLTGQDAFISAASYVGPKVRVDHDVSLLIPEIWCRMSPEERRPSFLLEHGHLERCVDFNHNGKTVAASRLGYRITGSFVRRFFGRVFNHPHAVFTEEMLRPELQGKDLFADGMENIVQAHERVARGYFDDGSIEQACPPLRALLEIMCRGSHEGRDLSHPEIRALFTREHLLSSDWYQERLAAKQRVDRRLWERHVASLGGFLQRPHYADEARRLHIKDRLSEAHRHLVEVQSPAYLASLRGTIGVHPWR